MSDLILGAWGCGVFQNRPAEIASLFADLLLHDKRFSRRFKTVVFAVLDGTADQRILEPFQNRFGGRSP